MIEAKDGEIRLVSTNLEMGVKTKIRGKIEKEGVYTVDAKIISDYIALLPNEKIDIELKDNKIIIELNKNKTKITGSPAEDFPVIPVVTQENGYQISINEFKKALAQTVFAVSNTETRVELSGVLFIFTGDELVLSATDSYRLTEKKIKAKAETKSEGEKKIIVPAKTVLELVRILGAARENTAINKNAEEIKIYFTDNQLLFSFGGVELVSRLIEGQYPDYKQIIPANSKTRAVVNRQELMRSIKIAALFSKENVNDVNLDLPQNRNVVIVSSASGQVGENITELEAVVDGDDNGVVVNYRYFLEGVNNMSEENVIISIINPNTPCLIKAENDNSYVYIIMPIKQ